MLWECGQSGQTICIFKRYVDLAILWTEAGPVKLNQHEVHHLFYCLADDQNNIDIVMSQLGMFLNVRWVSERFWPISKLYFKRRCWLLILCSPHKPMAKLKDSWQPCKLLVKMLGTPCSLKILIANSKGSLRYHFWSFFTFPKQLEV